MISTFGGVWVFWCELYRGRRQHPTDNHELFLQDYIDHRSGAGWPSPVTRCREYGSPTHRA